MAHKKTLRFYIHTHTKPQIKPTTPHTPLKTNKKTKPKTKPKITTLKVFTLYVF